MAMARTHAVVHPDSAQVPQGEEPMCLQPRIVCTMRIAFAVMCALVLYLLGAPLASADTVTVDVAQDTFINSSSSNNWGDWTYVIVGSNSSTGNERGLFKFNLPDKPSGATLESATFKAYYLMPWYGVTENMDITVHRLTKSWQENTATWTLMGSASDARVERQATGNNISSYLFSATPL